MVQCLQIYILMKYLMWTMQSDILNEPNQAIKGAVKGLVSSKRKNHISSNGVLSDESDYDERKQKIF